MLTELKGLPKDSHDLVWRLKQDKTLEIIDRFDIDSRIKGYFKEVKIRWLSYRMRDKLNKRNC